MYVQRLANILELQINTTANYNRNNKHVVKLKLIILVSFGRAVVLSHVGLYKCT